MGIFANKENIKSIVLGILISLKVIGKNTIDCMKSGVLYSNAGAIDGIIDRIEEELGHSCTLVATGGMAQFIVPLCKHHIILEKDLLLIINKECKPECQILSVRIFRLENF